MKPIVIIFVLLEVLDVLTTRLGLSLGMIELNPLYSQEKMLLIKLLVTTTVAICLQIIQSKRMKIILIPMYIVVVWNLINISTYYLG